MAKISATLVLALCLCMAITIPATHAQLLPPPIPGFPFPIPPFPGFPGIECLKVFGDVPQCLQEIFQAFVTGQLGGIGPACCKAITDADKCLPKMFPTNPSFSPVIIGRCSAAAPTPA